MTDILFVTISESTELRQEVNGSLILATKLLQENFAVRILRFGEFESWRKNYPEFIHQITERIQEISPKCVSFYTLCSTYHIVLRIAYEIRKRKPEIHIILGGPQASITAHDTIKAFDYIDYVCTGEGENTVVPFFHALLRNNGRGLDNIPGLFYRNGEEIVTTKKDLPVTDLETLPYWDDRLLLPCEGSNEPNISSNHYFMPIDAGRGCPFNCTFCSTSYFWKRKYRLKSPEKIVEDMMYFNNKYGIKSFNIAHDAFTVNEKLVAKVCDSIIDNDLKINWHCTTRIDCISKELIERMKDAGMRSISLGVESGSERMQKEIKKRLKLDTVKPMVRYLLDRDIKVTLFFMHGFPGETEEDLNETLELLFSLIDMGVRRVTMHLCLFDPATEITAKNYDQLIFDPSVNMIYYSIFGYNEEIPIIQQHKSIFSFFYHLNTPTRNNYLYLHYLAKTYEVGSDILSYIRKLYHGNNLQFYKDFYAANKAVFSDISYANDVLSNYPWKMISNLLMQLDIPNLSQVQGLVEFKNDVFKITQGSEDTLIKKKYSFNYNEYRAKYPLEAMSKATSELLLSKADDKILIRLLNVHNE